MKTYYKVIIARNKADMMFKRWLNQGWTATVSQIHPATVVVVLDMETWKDTDPTNHPEVLTVLQ